MESKSSLPKPRSGISHWLDCWIPGEILRQGGSDLRRGRLLVGFCSSLILVCLLAFVMMLFVEGFGGKMGMICIGSGLLYGANLWIFVQFRAKTLPGILLSLEMLMAMGFVVLLTGGILSPMVFWLGFIPVLGLFLIGRRWALCCLGFVMVSMIGLLVMELQQVIPKVTLLTNPTMQAINSFVLLSLFIFFSTMIAWFFESSREKAMQELARTIEEKRELAFTSETAQQASLAKSEFLATMSHELRTPLNAVIGYAEILQEDLERDEVPVYIPDVKKIWGAGHHLLSLINDILDLSKIEAGHMELYTEKVLVTDLTSGLREMIMPMLEKGQNTFSISIDESIDVMYADVTKLRQILFNLLSNAIKFTEKGGISLRVMRRKQGENAEIVFEVEDTGIGMDADKLEHLFDKFYQIDSSTTRKYAGTGLGLAISQSLCQLMGGAIDVRSQPGKGSVFTVILPMNGELPGPTNALQGVTSS